MLLHPETRLATTVAMHNRAMATPMLRAIIKQAGLTDEQFVELLRG